jgi:hypothetical protein
VLLLLRPFADAAFIGFAQREVDIYGNDEPAAKALAALASFLSRVA